MLVECQIILTRQKEFKLKLNEYSQWTNMTPSLIDIFDEFCVDHGNPENVILALLKITSVLEYSLGNVCKAITYQTPHLLKEILKKLSEVEYLQKPVRQSYILN